MGVNGARAVFAGDDGDVLVAVCGSAGVTYWG